jgi:hypothetical protein
MQEQKIVPVKEKFDVPGGVVIVPMDLQSGRRGQGPCGKVIDEAFIAGTEPERDCSGAAVAASKLPYYLQRPFYTPKESEPVQQGNDATAQPGVGAESPAPAVDLPQESAPPPPPATSTQPQ